MTALVVLPGLDGTASLLSAFADAALPHFSSVRVISYPGDQVLGYPELEVLARSKLPVDAPFVLVGESFSGPVALSIAANPPHGLVGLVLSTSFSRHPVPLLGPFAALAGFAPARRLPDALLSWLLLGEWATPELLRSLQSALESLSPKVLRARAAGALGVDCSANLASIALPVLYLRASCDRLISAAAGNRILAAIPHASLVEIPGPHLLLQAAPQASASAIAMFSADAVGRPLARTALRPARDNA
ncbi:MAG TPA: alpha/beta hydrolase [Lysobacter sp.]